MVTCPLTDVSQCSLNPVVAPGWIFVGESNDGIDDFLSDAWPTRFSFVAGVELLRHQLAVPAQYRLGRDDGRQLVESLSANGVSLHCESPTLVVIEQQSLLSELLQQSRDLSVLELKICC